MIMKIFELASAPGMWNSIDRTHAEKGEMSMFGVAFVQDNVAFEWKFDRGSLSCRLVERVAVLAQHGEEG